MVNWTLTQRVTLEARPKGDDDHHQQVLLQRKPEAGHLGTSEKQQDQPIGLSLDWALGTAVPGAAAAGW